VETLRAAERVVLIGYSLPLADHSVSGMLTEALGGRDVRIEIVNPAADEVAARLNRLGVSDAEVVSFAEPDCVARWTAAEVADLERLAGTGLREGRELGAEDVIWLDAPRAERMVRVEPADRGSIEAILHLTPADQQLVNPARYHHLQEALRGSDTCAVEVDGRLLPVIDFWRIPETGARMAQLHVVAAGR